MARGFMLVMFGLVLVLISIRVQGFDLLPEFIGFGLIGFGSGSLAQYSKSFGRSRNLAWLLAGFSPVGYFLPWQTAQSLFMIISILTIFLVCYLLTAVIWFTEERDRFDLAKHAVLYRRIYVGIAFVALLIQWAAWHEPEAAAGLMFLMGSATAVILAFILRLFYVVRHDLAVSVTA